MAIAPLPSIRPERLQTLNLTNNERNIAGKLKNYLLNYGKRTGNEKLAQKITEIIQL